MKYRRFILAEQPLDDEGGFADVGATQGGLHEASLLPAAGFSTLAQAVYLSGKIAAPPLCSGMSLCGRCRMRVVENTPAPSPADTAFFRPEDIAGGWRLGCRHMPEPGMVVEVPLEYGTAKKKGRPAFAEGTLSVDQGTGGKAAPRRAGLAVDLGTTSLHWMLVDDAGAVASGSMLNPQMGAGSDVISRLAVARSPAGKKRLSRLVTHELQSIIQDARTQGHAVTSLCLAANPAMTAVVLEKDIEGLAVAPYALPFAGNEWEALPSLPPIWVPPQLSPFVGGDISAGYAALALATDAEKAVLGGEAFAKPAEHDRRAAEGRAPSQTQFPFLLADMGTNGEFVLALSPEDALVASVALGPALEGIGLSCGSEARNGTVTGFVLTPLGLEPQIYRGEGQSDTSPVCGITGTGYISLMQRLLAAGALNRDGSFTGGGMLARYFERLRSGHGADTASDPASRTTEKYPGAGAPSGRRGEEPFLPLPHGLYLTATDVEEILKVKAAFSLGLSRLLGVAGVPFSSLKAVYLAGAMGEHMDPAALESAGFFPQGAASRVRVAGNTSLFGAALLLRHEALRDALANWARRVRALDLASDEGFLQDFSSHMAFSWQI